MVWCRRRLITDPVGRFLNDKNSITADPNDADFVYAVWDRLQVSEGSIVNPENVVGLGFKGPIYFTRTTNGGDSWEPARKIYETGANKQTLGNQIVVRPQGELFNFFADPASWEEVRITPAPFNIRNAPFARGYFLGDYMGLDNAGSAVLAMFGQAFTPNDANQYVSRLTP